MAGAMAFDRTLLKLFNVDGIYFWIYQISNLYFLTFLVLCSKPVYKPVEDTLIINSAVALYLKTTHIYYNRWTQTAEMKVVECLENILQSIFQAPVFCFWE